MSSDRDAVSSRAEVVIDAERLGKQYVLYPAPIHRLIHAIVPGRVYPIFTALNDVSFTVRRGETVGIIGQNGAGKSTLLQLITGTIQPSTGAAHVLGQVAALLELGAGFEPDFTGRENIMLNGTILGLTPGQVRDRMESIIAFAELAEFIDRPVRTYSSGMFMRLAFSVAAHVDADVLIIDEALAVGDARFAQKCLRFLRDFRRHGSILFVSHDLGAVTGLCDRAIWLDRGVVRGQGPAIEICERYVAALFERPDAVPETVTASAGTGMAPTGRAVVLLDEQSPPPGSVPGVTGCSAFNPAASSFGIGGASIVDAGLFDPASGARLQRVTEGQEVELTVVARADVAVAKPIIGFYVKDRLGQLLLGDNTFWENAPQPAIAPGGRGVARFRFRWPALQRGAYALTVALADGSMEHHVQRHWLHDAVVFDVLSSSARLAMVGVRLSRVTFDVAP
jgi:lipopolysaccharide transport system ATP-binding protein